MKIGDKVIYIFDPYGRNELGHITYATLTRPASASMFDKDPAIKPIENLHGEGGMHEQVAKESYLYEIGDHKVITKIFARGLE